MSAGGGRGTSYPASSGATRGERTSAPKSVQSRSRTCARPEVPIVRLGSAMARSVLLDHAAEILGVCRRTVYYRLCLLKPKHRRFSGQACRFLGSSLFGRE